MELNYQPGYGYQNPYQYSSSYSQDFSYSSTKFALDSINVVLVVFTVLVVIGIVLQLKNAQKFKPGLHRSN